MSEAGEILLAVKNLRVRRGGRFVLDVPELSVRRGEIICLIGPNGAGKSTLLQSIMRLLPLDGGEFFVDGQPAPGAQKQSSYRRSFSLVFQETLLFRASVYKNVASGLWIRGMGRSEVRRIVEEELERFGISHLMNKNAHRISGGEAQRVSLARAYAVRPRLLLLDEPFSSLDVSAREGLIEDLDRILRDSSMTAMLATHDRAEALRLADRIAVMHNGRIVQTGTPAEVMRAPASEFVAAFVGAETILSGSVKRAQRGSFLLDIGGTSIEVAGDACPGERLCVGIRPENVTLSIGQKARTSARNRFCGRITRIIAMPHYRKVVIDCGFTLIAFVTNQSAEDLGLWRGKRISASFKATSVHVIRRGDGV